MRWRTAHSSQKWTLLFIKAALINHFKLHNNESHDYFYVKGVARTDKHTESYHPTQQFPAAVQSFVAAFSSLFEFSGLKL